ncbi:hypothetical protein AB0N64_14550 [Microbacterium sp. NPDC089318]
MSDLVLRSAWGRPCTLCRHAQRAEIERTLASGTATYRAIARQFGLSRDAVRRHVDAHLDVADREALRAVSPAPALDLAAALADIADHAADTRRDADARGDDALALRAGRAEVVARLALADRLGVTTADAHAELAEADDLVSAVLMATRDRPDVADALAAALDDLGRTRAARDLRARAASIRETTARTLAPALEVSA